MLVQFSLKVMLEASSLDALDGERTEVRVI